MKYSFVVRLCWLATPSDHSDNRHVAIAMRSFWAVQGRSTAALARESETHDAVDLKFLSQSISAQKSPAPKISTAPSVHHSTLALAPSSARAFSMFAFSLDAPSASRHRVGIHIAAPHVRVACPRVRLSSLTLLDSESDRLIGSIAGVLAAGLSCLFAFSRSWLAPLFFARTFIILTEFVMLVGSSRFLAQPPPPLLTQPRALLAARPLSRRVVRPASPLQSAALVRCLASAAAASVAASAVGVRALSLRVVRASSSLSLSCSSSSSLRRRDAFACAPNGLVRFMSTGVGAGACYRYSHATAAFAPVRARVSRRASRLRFHIVLAVFSCGVQYL